MKLKDLFLNSALIAVLCVPAAFAQSGATSPPTPAPNQPPDGQQIQQRKENQQDRIANGVQSGQLTAGETKQLETRESRINKEEHNMATENGGKLTQADRARLTRQQNRLSNKIYGDKHNAADAEFGNGKIGQRRENQQDRIAQGIRSGQLTPSETAHLEGKEQHLNREMAGARQLNGGKLTKGQRAAANRQQNRLSAQIYKDKHNTRRQRP
jgi:hypothetical protein